MCGRARLSTDLSEIRDRFPHPARSADAEFRRQLERGADRPAAGPAL
jgi:hypothetical protein